MSDGGTIALPHGPLRHRLLGDPAGRPVLLIHGAGMHAGWWMPTIAHLPAGYRLIVPDLRGHGGSAWDPAGGYRLEDFTADLEALLDAIAPGPVAVVAHSMGGRVALWLAAHAPDRVSALVLLDSRVTGLQPDRIDRWRGMRAGRGERRGFPTRAAAMERFRITPDEPGIDAEDRRVLAEAAVVERAPGDWALRFDRNALGLDGSRIADLTPLLPRVACPTLFVRGADSTVVGERGTGVVVAGLRDGRAAVIPGGHHFALSHPRETAALLTAFLPPARLDTTGTVVE